MKRTLSGILLLLLAGSTLAQDAPPTPRQCFDDFVALVLNRGELGLADRLRKLEAAYDLEAWMQAKEAVDGKAYAPEERLRFKADWLTVLASDTFREAWQRQAVRVFEEPEPVGTEATLTIRLGEVRGRDFLVKLRFDADQQRWRVYDIVAQGQVAPELAEPRTPQEKLRIVQQALDEIAQVQAELEQRRAALEQRQRELQAEIEEHRAGGELATPRELALALGNAITAKDWGAFALSHLPEHRTDVARARFEASAARIESWAVREIVVVREGESALLVIDAKVSGRLRALTLRAVRQGGRWWVSEGA